MSVAVGGADLVNWAVCMVLMVDEWSSFIGVFFSSFSRMCG